MDSAEAILYSDGENALLKKVYVKEAGLKYVKWLNVLHFYQSPIQDIDVLQQITEECYIPVTRLLLRHHHASCVININGCLLEMLEKQVSGGKEVIDNLRSLYERNQIELAGTGKYHPIFPLIPKSELQRQLSLQEESLFIYLNVKKTPSILFLPELAYNPDQAEFLKETGYNMLIIDETSLWNKSSKMGQKKLREKEKGVFLLVRDRDISEALSSSILKKKDINSSEDFIRLAQNRYGKEDFVVTATDVEVFGHHQKNRWELLAEIYNNSAVKGILPEEIDEHYEPVDVNTVPSSWSTSEDDVAKRVYFPLWFHPQNRMHRLLWQLLDIAIDETRKQGNEHQNHLVDRLLSSCPFFWSSCRPWWNGIMAEKAADNMLGLLSNLNGISERILHVSESLRNKIYDEVAYLNTGKARELQDEFLKKNHLKREDLTSSLL